MIRGRIAGETPSSRLRCTSFGRSRPRMLEVPAWSRVGPCQLSASIWRRLVTAEQELVDLFRFAALPVQNVAIGPPRFVPGRCAMREAMRPHIRIGAAPRIAAAPPGLRRLRSRLAVNSSTVDLSRTGLAGDVSALARPMQAQTSWAVPPAWPRVRRRWRP